jgi:hypothetical protein
MDALSSLNQNVPCADEPTGTGALSTPAPSVIGMTGISPSPTPTQLKRLMSTPTQTVQPSATKTPEPSAKAPAVVGGLPSGGEGPVNLDQAGSAYSAIKPYLIRGVTTIEIYASDSAQFDAVQNAFHDFSANDEFGDYLAGFTAEMTSGVAYQGKTSNYMVFQVQYAIPSSEVWQAVKAVNDKAASFAASTGGSTRERVIAAAKYVASNASYGGGGGYQNTSYGNMINGSCNCEGYAHALMVVLKRMGIDCVRVRGAIAEGDHAWVKVKSDGAWYHIDPTFISVMGDDSYAWMSESEISANHSW